MNLELREACFQNFRRSDAEPLPLEWKPPSTRTAIYQWGATLQDYSCIFSFWTKTTTQDDDNLVRLTTWTQALAVFIQIGGNAAPFLSRCPNLTMAVFKFKVLSCKILKAQTALADLAVMLDEDVETNKWLTVFPREAAFPQAIKILTSWDLSEIFTCYICSRERISVFMQKPLKFALPILIMPFLNSRIACVLTRFLGRGLLLSFLARDPSPPGWRWYTATG